jgi:hypothetical protein
LLILSGTVGTGFRSGAYEHSLTDEAYTHFAVVHGLLDRAEYSLVEGRPAAPLQHTLWRLAIWLCALGTESVVGGALLLGAVCIVTTLILTGTWSRLVSDRFYYLMLAGIAVALAPGFCLHLTTGSSQPLATLLITAACVWHAVRTGQGDPLPLGAAVLLGFAAWVNILLPLVWFGLAAHAWATYPEAPAPAPGQGLTPGRSLHVRALMGVGIMAAIAAPLFMWTYNLVGVGWPRLPGVQIDAALWAEQPIHALLLSIQAMLAAVPESYARLASVPFLGTGLGRSITWLGLLLVTLIATRDRGARNMSALIFVLLITPLLAALASPYLGWRGVDMLFAALEPLCLATAVAGLWLLVPAQDALLKRLPREVPAYTRYVAPCVLLLALVVQTSLVSKSLLRDHADQMGLTRRCREAILQHALEGDLSLNTVVTDQPGWLAWQRMGDVVDLSGEFSARDILGCLSPDGDFDEDCLRACLRDRQPTLYVLWREPFQKLRIARGGDQLVTAARARQYGLPRVIAANAP